MPCDVFNYRRIILGNIRPSNYDIINHNSLNKYKNYTTFIQSYDYQNSLPLTHMIGYNLSTINGKYWMPVFNKDLAEIRNIVNIQIKEASQNKIVKALIFVGIPYVATKIIIKYI